MMWHPTTCSECSDDLAVLCQGHILMEQPGKWMSRADVMRLFGIDEKAALPTAADNDNRKKVDEKEEW